MSTHQLSCGRDLTCVPDLATVLQSCKRCGFDFVSIPIVHPRYKREFFSAGSPRPGPLTRSDLILSSTEWNSIIVAKMSPWIDLDSSCADIRKNSEKAFFQEVSLAAHLSVPAIYVELKSYNCINLARCIGQVLQNHSTFLVWVYVPMVEPEKALTGCEEDVEENDNTWEWWNRLRTICAGNRRLGLALGVNSEEFLMSEVHRWCGEPIKVVLLPTDIFLKNKKGFPVLSRCFQNLLNTFFKLDIQFLLTGACKVDYGIQTYKQYLDRLFQVRPQPTMFDVFAKGYEDYLQNPLQPLMDNLDSQTYETFEKDPVKYLKYEEAVELALRDKLSGRSDEDAVFVVMVVGAGRGPLVKAALNASRNSQIQIRVYAVEKNPGAVITLQNLQAEQWGDKVTVVHSDMRHWEAPEKADILVSELLGSFGDNELSPECLDGALSFMKDDGISIPSLYSSFLCPISAAKLHHEVGLYKDKLGKVHAQGPYETPYVVRFSNVTTLSEPQLCFTFKHPNRDQPIDNQRCASLRFHVEQSTVLHGFAGYFECNLYNGINLSIHPKSHTQGMISWFPIYFPTFVPVYVPSCSEVELHIWRCCSPSKVWYEWCLTEPQLLPVHNPNGRSYWIGL